ncbi:hypothetical protein [Flavobacterium sp.]|uniref:hypothetical protein n=1 Tax=Flavobacterium sp. TaxID=239 RepID=UPI004033F876
MGRLRTMQICLSDLPQEKIITAGNGKQYISLATWDLDEPNHRDQDFVVSVTRNKEEYTAQVPRVYVGGGVIDKNY